MTVAELLDIQSDANGNHNTLKAPIPSLEAYSNTTMPEPAAVDNFLHKLQRCGPNVHTRIVVLHSGRFLSGDRAVDSLFFCHVLGIELDLCPTDVCDLAQLDNHRDGWAPTDMQPRQRLPMKPGFVSLAFSKETRKRSVAAYIGRRQMGQSAPHVGKLCNSLLTKLASVRLTIYSRCSPSGGRLLFAALEMGFCWRYIGAPDAIWQPGWVSGPDDGRGVLQKRCPALLAVRETPEPRRLVRILVVGSYLHGCCQVCRIPRRSHISMARCGQKADNRGTPWPLGVGWQALHFTTDQRQSSRSFPQKLPVCEILGIR
jgi:hypothetical protein